MRSPAAERRRPTVWDGLVVLAVVLLAGVLVFLLRPSEGSAVTAVVTLDGAVVAQYRLDQLEEPVTLTLEEASYPLTIQAEHGRIRIAESSCPGQDCVHTGWASRAGQQLICLPNRLVIALEGETSEGIDAVTG